MKDIDIHEMTPAELRALADEKEKIQKRLIRIGFLKENIYTVPPTDYDGPEAGLYTESQKATAIKNFIEDFNRLGNKGDKVVCSPCPYVNMSECKTIFGEELGFLYERWIKENLENVRTATDEEIEKVKL